MWLTSIKILFCWLNNTMTTQHQCKKRVKYSPDAMLAAINGVRTGGHEQNGGVPHVRGPEDTATEQAGRPGPRRSQTDWA